MKVTERQRDLLETLRSVEHSRARMGRDPETCRITPLDLGATSNSHHSATLKQLAVKGLVRREKFGCYCKAKGDLTCRCKGSCSYHTTSEGRRTLAQLNLSRKGQQP